MARDGHATELVVGVGDRVVGQRAVDTGHLAGAVRAGRLVGVARRADAVHHRRHPRRRTGRRCSETSGVLMISLV